MASGVSDDNDEIGRNKRCPGAGDCTEDDDDGEIGRNKSCRVAGDCTEDDGEIGLNERCRGADDCTDNDGGESGRNKRFRVAADSMGHNGESGDGTSEDHMYDDWDDEEDEETKDDSCSAREKEQRYIVLTEDVVRARQEADTAKVAEVLSIPSGFAAVLLRHLKWRAGRVQEEWFSGDRRVRDAVGLPAGGDPVPTALNSRRLICAICFNGYSAGRMRSAGCYHYYCDDCWRGYIRVAVDDGPRCLSLRCPDPCCSAAVVQELVSEVAEDADKARYARFALRSYVEESGGRIKWCPGPGCSRAVEFLGCAGDAKDVFCECKHGFCWSCGEEAHRPVSCGTARAWLLKNSSDSETANWVVANTKHCPKCQQPIEKNHGCNHMRCRCGHRFCWICLDPAGDGNHYSCEGYRPQLDKADAGGKVETKEEERKRQAKASLDRYLYHYERWAANHASLQKALADMDQLEHSGFEEMAAALDIRAKDLHFLTEAYHQITDGRRVLRWAHAYGYYLDPERDAAKRALFDDLKNQANRLLERLHCCAELERKELFCADGEASIARELLKYYKDKVVNLTAVARIFLDNLVKAFETDLPEFNSLN
ncbi:probable E3 ubiquitin-protein ligase ARI5 [Phragmites australis]|uniref:probable E3 ubiquitin-protein ligase ARI5 n=1 Tax=Phragmites australis TaxID=29695 RepID=UPI002D78FE2C|nr:probable E3 ubiquitin-protein ligase ARI5 [Phragmites australis]